MHQAAQHRLCSSAATAPVQQPPAPASAGWCRAGRTGGCGALAPQGGQGLPEGGAAVKIHSRAPLLPLLGPPAPVCWRLLLPFGGGAGLLGLRLGLLLNVAALAALRINLASSTACPGQQQPGMSTAAPAMQKGSSGEWRMQTAAASRH